MTNMTQDRLSSCWSMTSIRTPVQCVHCLFSHSINCSLSVIYLVACFFLPVGQSRLTVFKVQGAIRNRGHRVDRDKWSFKSNSHWVRSSIKAPFIHSFGHCSPNTASFTIPRRQHSTLLSLLRMRQISQRDVFRQRCPLGGRD